jgi:hypothetical protein
MALRRSILAATVVLLLSLPAAAQTFVFDLRGAQEVPPVASPFSGGCHGQLDQGAATFSLTCVHNVLNATVMHIHRAPAGANGVIAFDLGDPSVSPVVATWSGMTPADIAELLAGDLYINIHTAGRPAGEIRGQILSRTVDFVAFNADGSQAVPPQETAATASCTADLDAAATSLAVQCTHTLAAATSAHVHEAPQGTNGPIVFTFPSAASPLIANVALTPRLVADFAATFLYLDLHTPEGTEENPSVEIRGQIGTPPAPVASGTVIIEKETAPAGGSGFSFSESITSGTFSLDHGGTETFTAVAPGTYTVTESDPSGSGHSLAAIVCDDADSTVDTNTRTATVRVTGSETVRCTFRNFEAAATDSLFVFHLSGDQEVPPVTTTATGGCMARFDAGASELAMVCTHDVDLATIMHIHRAPAGANGDIAFDMGDPTSPVVATWSGMTPADVADLFAGNFYLNIHTAGRPAGEIRGQILPRTIDTVNFIAEASQTVPPGDTSATATCTADLDTNATTLALSCTHNLPAPDAAHVHQGARGTTGPVAFTFPSPASPFAANMPMTPRLVADFAGSLLYLDIHGVAGGEEAAGDEIRGQIAAPVAAPTTGTIRIRKVTSPAGGTGFTFTQSMTAGSFALDDGGEEVFLNVPPGTHTITEDLLAGWSLTDVRCSDVDSMTNVFSRTAAVSLDAGETVTCTFTNLQSAAASSDFVFHLSGDQEAPPTASTARGGCYGRLDSTTRRLSLVCTHNVDGPGVAHIHEAPPGANGPIVFDVGDPVSPIEATWDMSPTQMASLLAGSYYLNIHTSGRPAGEIRGQILPRTVDRFTFDASGDEEVPPNDSSATGNCLADLGDDPSAVFIQCTHDVANVTTVHLHAAPPGVDGPVIFDFPNTNPFSSNVPLTPRLIADFAAGFLYVNIHSTLFDAGEIRGQLLGPAAAAPGEVTAIPTLPQWGLLLLAAALGIVAMRRMG